VPGCAAAGAAPPLVLAKRISDEAEVWGALVVGLRDYVAKNGFRSVVLGMSGGIDSAVVASIAADAIGGGNVHGVSMPSAYSSEHSRSDASDLAQRLGANYRGVPIATSPIPMSLMSGEAPTSSRGGIEIPTPAKRTASRISGEGTTFIPASRPAKNWPRRRRLAGCAIRPIASSTAAETTPLVSEKTTSGREK